MIVARFWCPEHGFGFEVYSSLYCILAGQGKQESVFVKYSSMTEMKAKNML